MPLGFKSAILRHTNSIKRPTLNGLKDTIRSTRSNITTDGGYESNDYIHETFFTKDNYQSIIKCLDEGYKICMNLIGYMQDYNDLQLEYARSLTSHSNKWSSKIKQQLSLSSYHTTKRAQLKTSYLPDKIAQLITSRCDAIQQVIDTYQGQVERMYPSERLGTSHKHHRTDHIRKAFKAAQSTLSKLTDLLEKLHEQEKQAKQALHEADVQCENLGLDPTASKNKVTRAKDTQEKRQYELEDIQEKITRTEKDYDREQEIYREKGIEIYKECRDYEKERLDQIRETLLEFSLAAHSSEYCDEQNTLFDDLIEHIDAKQNSIEDLDFWAQTYHIDYKTKSKSSETTDDAQRKPKKSQKNEAHTPTEENTQQKTIVPDDNKEESTVKTKSKKTKTSTSTEKKRDSPSEPTTPITPKSQSDIINNSKNATNKK
ncbi:unnamed protein product [Adineta steineri]|uniref:Uncharacterized protein n=1 Tax=Adineta steineri TaxID=433720 RepID=A0A815ZNQ0_9BILA|nr:unnamed protein product [Adineta steineri]CAF1584598.1 unnamed protein product [Adineta steineri]